MIFISVFAFPHVPDFSLVNMNYSYLVRKLSLKIRFSDLEGSREMSAILLFLTYGKLGSERKNNMSKATQLISKKAEIKLRSFMVPHRVPFLPRHSLPSLKDTVLVRL